MSGADCSPIVLRTKGAVAICGVVEGKSGIETFSTIPGESASTCWNSKCSVLLVYTESLVQLVKLSEDGSKASLGQPKLLQLPYPTQTESPPLIRWASLSPQGLYAAILYQISSEAPNLHIWAVDEPRLVHTFSVPGQMNSEHLVWRDDDKFYGVRQKDSVNFYAMPEGLPLATVPVAPGGETSIHISPSRSGHDLTAFVFTACTFENTFGLMQIVRLPAGGAVAWIIEQKFDCVDGVECVWSSSGAHMLCVASAQVDARGENYGSVGDVWLKSMQAVETPFTKMNKAVVQEAAWSPTADEFAMVEGKSPSDCTLTRVLTDAAGGRQTATTLFHRGYKNTIRWSPRGEMLVIGGFGNLAGDMAFYHRVGAGLELVSEKRCSCTVKCEWSPCGRYFMTASLWPRMRVDNRVTIWKRDGTLMLENPVDTLYDASWVDLASSYPDLPKPEISGPGVSAAASVFKPKGQTSESTDLIQLYISGRLKLEELPAHLQAKLKTSRPARAAKAKADPRVWRGAGAEESGEQAVSAKNAKAKKQFSSPATKSRSEPSTAPNTSSAAATAAEEPPRRPDAAPAMPAMTVANFPPAGEVYIPQMRAVEEPLRYNELPPPPPPAAGGGNIVALLQQILPPTSTVHIGGAGRPAAPAAYRFPPPPPPPASPPPPAKWYYTDPRGTVQGPFSRRQMRAWWEKGYFPHSLRVRMEHEAEFRPLSRYYPEASAAFTF